MRGRRPRVGCRFRGGLANQMFTVATTLAYGWRHNLDITISARQLTSAANTQFAGRNSVMPLFREIPRSWKRTAINASTRRDRFELHEFAPIGPPQDENDIVLDGLFGHCGYFDDARNQLLQVFRPQHRTAAALDARFASLFDGETVSVSIRRGDYLRQRTLRPLRPRAGLLPAGAGSAATSRQRPRLQRTTSTGARTTSTLIDQRTMSSGAQPWLTCTSLAVARIM